MNGFNSSNLDQLALKGLTLVIGSNRIAFTLGFVEGFSLYLPKTEWIWWMKPGI